MTVVRRTRLQERLGKDRSKYLILLILLFPVFGILIFKSWIFPHEKLKDGETPWFDPRETSSNSSISNEDLRIASYHNDALKKAVVSITGDSKATDDYIALCMARDFPVHRRRTMYLYSRAKVESEDDIPKAISNAYGVDNDLAQNIYLEAVHSGWR